MLESVSNRATEEPLAPYGGTSPEMAALQAYPRSKRVFTYMPFTVCFVAPPLIITKEELQYGLDIFEEALAEIDKMIAA